LAEEGVGGKEAYLEQDSSYLYASWRQDPPIPARGRGGKRERHQTKICAPKKAWGGQGHSKKNKKLEGGNENSKA